MIIDEQKIKEAMEAFGLEISLPKILVPEEISDIINASRDYLKNQDKEELSVDMVRLAQYSLFLTKEANRYRGVIGWCNANIKSIIGRELDNTSGYGYIEKSTKIERGDSKASKLVEIKTFVETKLAIIGDLDRKLEFMANCIKTLVINKS